MERGGTTKGWHVLGRASKAEQGEGRESMHEWHILHQVQLVLFKILLTIMTGAERVRGEEAFSRSMLLYFAFCLCPDYR